MTKTEPREWQDFAQKAMELAGLSQVELGKILSKKLGYQISQGSIHSRIKGAHGKAPKADDELKAWADALKLDGQHRERFLRLALMESTPPGIRARLATIEMDLERLQRHLKAEKKRSDELSALVDCLRRELAKNTAEAASLVQRLQS